MHAVRCAVGVFNPIQVPTDFGVDPYGALDTENMSRGEGGGSRSITRSPVSGNILLRGSVEDWAGYFAGWVCGDCAIVPLARGPPRPRLLA